MYRLAPVNAVERHGSRVAVGDGVATVQAPVGPDYKYCHTAGALHQTTTTSVQK